jgi:hypothetical protein
LRIHRDRNGAAVAVLQQLGAGREVTAGVEGVLDGQAQQREVSAIDLAEPQIDAAARCDQALRCRAGGFGGPWMKDLARRPVGGQRQGIKAALDTGDGEQGLGRHRGRAGLCKTEHCGQGKDHETLRKDETSRSRAQDATTDGVLLA